jgi:hypothetical protein
LWVTSKDRGLFHGSDGKIIGRIVLQMETRIGIPRIDENCRPAGCARRFSEADSRTAPMGPGRWNIAGSGKKDQCWASIKTDRYLVTDVQVFTMAVIEFAFAPVLPTSRIRA